MSLSPAEEGSELLLLMAIIFAQCAAAREARQQARARARDVARVEALRSSGGGKGLQHCANHTVAPRLAALQGLLLNAAKELLCDQVETLVASCLEERATRCDPLCEF